VSKPGKGPADGKSAGHSRGGAGPGVPRDRDSRDKGKDPGRPETGRDPAGYGGTVFGTGQFSRRTVTGHSLREPPRPPYAPCSRIRARWPVYGPLPRPPPGHPEIPVLHSGHVRPLRRPCRDCGGRHGRPETCADEPGEKGAPDFRACRPQPHPPRTGRPSGPLPPHPPRPRRIPQTDEVSPRRRSPGFRKFPPHRDVGGGIAGDRPPVCGPLAAGSFRRPRSAATVATDPGTPGA
jgi:hypothetical protein